jgi:hypothetical protein
MGKSGTLVVLPLAGRLATLLAIKSQIFKDSDITVQEDV